MKDTIYCEAMLSMNKHPHTLTTKLPVHRISCLNIWWNAICVMVSCNFDFNMLLFRIKFIWLFVTIICSTKYSFTIFIEFCWVEQPNSMSTMIFFFIYSKLRVEMTFNYFYYTDLLYFKQPTTTTCKNFSAKFFVYFSSFFSVLYWNVYAFTFFFVYFCFYILFDYSWNIDFC